MNILKKFLCHNCKELAESKRKFEKLKKSFNDLEEKKFNDYITSNLKIYADRVVFDAKELAEIFAKSFYPIVKDTENFVVLSFKNYTDPANNMEVIIVKEGKLAPLEKLAKQEKEISELKMKLESLESTQLGSVL